MRGGHRRSEVLQQRSAEGDHVVGVGQIEAQIGLAHHGQAGQGQGLPGVGGEGQVGRTQGGHEAQQYLAGGALGIVAQGDDRLGLALLDHLGQVAGQDVQGLGPAKLAVAPGGPVAQQRGGHPDVVVIKKLQGRGVLGNHAALAQGVLGVALHPDGPGAVHPALHQARLGAGAGLGVDHVGKGHRTVLGHRDPRPVLGPDGGVVHELVHQRARVHAQYSTHGQLDKCSSIPLHKGVSLASSRRLFVAYEAGAVHAVFAMALGAVVHFHAVGRSAQADGPGSPDIPTVAR